MIESGLISLFNSDAPLTSLVAGRMYPVILPDSPMYPAITYRLISSVPSYDLDGNIISTTTRIEFTAHGQAYSDCKAIQAAISDVLDGFTGSLSDDSSVSFSWRDGAAVDDFDAASRAYMTSVDYRFTHSS